MAHALSDVIDGLCAGEDLCRGEARSLFGRIVRGELSEMEIAAVLVALKGKGEHPAEIAGAAEALREAAAPFDGGPHALVDTCGTGGDGTASVNISTAVAVLLAEMGLAVAKHGNRSISSQCGSADVLEAVGVSIDAPASVARRCLDEAGICFLFAPQYHAGMRYAMPVRRALGVRTVFNLLGPLLNPGRPRHQLVGVYDPALCEPVAETLGLLGCEGALVVHGGGMDEIALHAPTTCALWRDGRVETMTITPQDAGLSEHPLSALGGGDVAQNSAWLRDVLAGRGTEAHNAAIALNAGALCWVAGRASDLRAGVAQALDTLRAGAAAERLAHWAAVSQAD